MTDNVSVKKADMRINAILNVIRQVLKIFFPLITYPYALKTLGLENIGKVDYAASIITYFTLIASLGISNYAIREGSVKRSDRDNISQFVSEIFTINVFSTLVSFIGLALILFFVDKLKPYIYLIIIQSLSIIFLTFGIDWINNIFEDYLYITLRTILTYIFTIILLFIFVKETDDYYIYSFITVGANAIICIMNWFYCKKYVNLKLVLNKNCIKHIKPVLVLFANYVAIQIYISADITMLGWMDSDISVGMYSANVKVYNIVKNIMVAIYAVTIPQLANLAMNKDFEEYKKINTRLWGTMILILLPAGIGLFMISKEVLFFLGGPELIAADLSLKLLSISLILSIFGGLVTAVMNITLKRDKNTLIATCFGAILNIILNIILIPKYSINGTAFTTLVAEGFVFIFCLLSLKNIKKYLDISEIFKNLAHAITGCCIIIISYIIVAYFVNNPFCIIILVCITSCLGYIVSLMILKNDLFLSIIQSMVDKMKKNKFIEVMPKK